MIKKFTIAHPALTSPANVALSSSTGAGDAAYTATVNDTVLHVAVERVGEDAGVLRLDGRVLPYRAVRCGKRLHVWLSGRTYAFDLLDGAGRNARASAAGALTDLVAPMPGTVREVRVTAGDVFAAHAPLVVLESMKMEMTLSAPADGKVAAVLCGVGDLVEMGATLLELTKATTDGDAN